MRGNGERRSDGSGLIVGAEAPRAQVDPLHLAVDGNPDGMDVGRPAAVGMPLGVTHVMPELRRFSTYFTLQCLVPFDR